MKPRRVVITGIGVVTPIGTGREQFWDGLQGRCRGSVPSPGSILPRSTPASRARWTDFQPTDHIEERRARRLDRFSQFSIAATRLALADAELDLPGRTATGSAR